MRCRRSAVGHTATPSCRPGQRTAADQRCATEGAHTEQGGQTGRSPPWRAGGPVVWACGPVPALLRAAQPGTRCGSLSAAAALPTLNALARQAAATRQAAFAGTARLYKHHLCVRSFLHVAVLIAGGMPSVHAWQGQGERQRRTGGRRLAWAGTEAGGALGGRLARQALRRCRRALLRCSTTKVRLLSVCMCSRRLIAPCWHAPAPLRALRAPPCGPPSYSSSGRASSSSAASCSGCEAGAVPLTQLSLRPARMPPPCGMRRSSETLPSRLSPPGRLSCAVHSIPSLTVGPCTRPDSTGLLSGKRWAAVEGEGRRRRHEGAGACATTGVCFCPQTTAAHLMACRQPPSTQLHPAYLHTRSGDSSRALK